MDVFSPTGNLARATRLSSVAMRENSSDVIEVRLTARPNTLEVLRNQEVLSFAEQSWMDLQGENRKPSFINFDFIHVDFIHLVAL